MRFITYLDIMKLITLFVIDIKLPTIIVKVEKNFPVWIDSLSCVSLKFEFSYWNIWNKTYSGFIMNHCYSIHT